MSYENPTSSSFNKTEPSTSTVNIDENNLELYIKNDKAEIELLESTEKSKSDNKDENTEVSQDDERIAKIKFFCCSCEMQEMVHYFGLEPNFVFGVKFNEPTYIMRDPFQPPPPKWKPKAEYFVALGAHCKLCDNVVCKDNECSFFYINTYCLSCAKKIVTTFPLDIQQKVKKQLVIS